MKLKPIAAIAACAALLATSAAEAAPICVPQQDAATAMLVFAPGALRAVRTACAPKLTANAYLSRRGAQLIQRYEAAVEQSGAHADEVVARIIGLHGLPIAASAVSALAETLVAPITKDLDQEDCGMIDRGLDLIDPLPVTSAAGLFVLVAEARIKTDAHDKPASPLLPFAICPANQG